MTARLARPIAAAMAVAALGAALPAGAGAAPAWQVRSIAADRMAPGGGGTFALTVTNVGDSASDGSGALDIALAPGITGVALHANPGVVGAGAPLRSWSCSDPAGASAIHCQLGAPVAPGWEAELGPLSTRFPGQPGAFLRVAVAPGASGVLTSTFEASGGGASAPASASDPTDVGDVVRFGVASFDGQVTAGPPPVPPPDPADSLDPANFGPAFTQAGGHPYAVSASLRLRTRADAIYGHLWPDDPVKDLLVDVPPGLVGNPTAVAQCTPGELVGTGNNQTLCPAASQVGVVTLSASACPEVCTPIESLIPKRFVDQPVFNMVPPPAVPARFAFIVAGTVVTLDGAVRSGSDYGLSVNVRNVPEGLPVLGADLTLWGVPADPSHTPLRHCPGLTSELRGCAAGVPPRAFLTLPTSCRGPLEVGVRADSWLHPGAFARGAFTSHLAPASTLGAPVPSAQRGAPQGATGCDRVPFAPAFEARPDVTVSPGPSGWTFDLALPQEAIDEPEAIAQSHVRSAVVTLPAGVRISPSAADGLAACTPGQIGLASTADATCPDASKVGSLAIETPLLDEPLKGSVYLATPHENPSGSLLALYLVAKGAGVIVKLPARIAADPRSGQLTTRLDELPELPFSRVRLHLFGGPRAALSNPPRCGAHATSAVIGSWSGRVSRLGSGFATSHDGRGAPCPPARFAPALAAGTTTAGGQVPAGGSFSRFVLRLSRSDDDEELAAIRSLALPGGLLARVAGVPLCAAGRAAAGTCPEASRIGSAAAAAGPGPSPFEVRAGRVYLGGRYRGAPFSLSIVVPAVAGPFDLGTVVVRAALELDRASARLRVAADPLPRILQGIPLQLRSVEVSIDRQRFVVNPTSCSARRIRATVESAAGTLARPGARFKVEHCAALPLAPRLRIVVGASGRTRAGAVTPLRATLTQSPGQAGIRAVGVTLPRTLNARLGVVQRACTRAAFDAGRCGSGARAGSATAVTPLLSRPVGGGAYFVQQPSGKGLPNLIVALRGQVDVDLVGSLRVGAGGSLGARFAHVPDVPLTRFTLRLVGGRNGPVGAVEGLCSAKARRQVARIAFRGQNGKLAQASQPLVVRGCAGGRGR